MKRFMQDLGELAGLDIVAAAPCAPVRAVEGRPDAVPAGAELTRNALHWLGLAAVGAGRCRAGGSAGADPAAAAPDGVLVPRLH